MAEVIRGCTFQHSGIRERSGHQHCLSQQSGVCQKGLPSDLLCTKISVYLCVGFYLTHTSKTVIFLSPSSKWCCSKQGSFYLPPKKKRNAAEITNPDFILWNDPATETKAGDQFKPLRLRPAVLCLCHWWHTIGPHSICLSTWIIGTCLEVGSALIGKCCNVHNVSSVSDVSSLAKVVET